MTLVLIWTDNDGFLWSVSDSRLTSGPRPLTDRAAKLLELPVVLLKQDAQNVLGRPIAETRLGFAYAGSALIALHTYAAVLPLWRHLLAAASEQLPSVEECATNLAAFLKGYAQDVHRTSPGATCECALFGWCPVAKRHRGYAIRVEQRNSETDLHMRLLDLSGGRIEILGTDKARFSEALQTYLDKAGRSQSPDRAPKQFLKDFLAAGAGDTIGGALQIGIASYIGFSVYKDFFPSVSGEPPAIMSYRGFDGNETKRLGAHIINMPGMG